jgi:hypothetical protein
VFLRRHGQAAAVRWRCRARGLCLAVLALALASCTAKRGTEQRAQNAQKSDFELEVALGELPRDLSAAKTLAYVHAAAGVWNLACSGVELRVEASHEVGRLAQDGRRVIAFRRYSWCPDGERRRSGCYPADALAMTSTHATAPPLSDGHLESDIEINSVTPKWSKFGATGSHSLVSVLAHELGHALGFEHPCNDGTLLKSDKPSCSAAEASVRRSVMFPAPPEKGAQAPTPPPELSAQERAELCRKYPAR